MLAIAFHPNFNFINSDTNLNCELSNNIKYIIIVQISKLLDLTLNKMYKDTSTRFLIIERIN